MRIRPMTNSADRLSKRQKATLLLVLLAAVACGNAPTSDSASAEDPFAVVLEAIADTSIFGKRMRVDPRTLAAGSESWDLLPITPAQLELRTRVIEAQGLPVGDALLAYECDGTRRITITQGTDTLVWPTEPPLSQAMIERCLAYEAAVPGRQQVLLQEEPQREGDDWLVVVHILGSGAFELWEVLLSGDLAIKNLRWIIGGQS